MSLASKILSAAGSGVGKLNVGDVFSAYPFTFNATPQTITNGLDLAGKGGMVWLKNRDLRDHAIYDTGRGINASLRSNTTGAAITYPTDTLTAFNSNGFSLGEDINIIFSNGAGDSMASWTFRKAPKFFDVVTWTGNGTNRAVAHALGQEVGLIFVKRTDSAADWQVYHRSIANTEYMVLNSTAAKATGATRWNSTTPTTSVFSVGTDATVNASGGTYVAYLFAHDASTDGVVHCGTFTTDGSGNATVNHGWSAGVQFAAIKASSTTDSWEMYDTARTAAWSGSDARLRSNFQSAEDSVSRLSASGTSVSFSGLSVSATYVYLFIVAAT